MSSEKELKEENQVADSIGDIMAIDISNLTFSYYNNDEMKVLDNVNFSLQYGEVALLAGMSGQGKSTFFNVINGVIPNVTSGVLSGEVNINGESIIGKSIGYISKMVGSVLQNADAQIIQPISADEIAFGCENIGMSPIFIEKKIIESCNIMKLDATQNTRTLSGGQKQRLITATTLAMGRKIIILDEPLANLDTEGASMLMLALRRLADDGYAVLVIEHRLDMVIEYVDSVWHIENGKVDSVNIKQHYLASQSIVIEDIAMPCFTNESIFCLDNVSYEVKSKSILAGINFEINKGERVVLIGENGCGKTTLLKLIAKLIKPTNGEIIQSLDKKYSNRKKGSKSWYKDVGVVYQNPNYQLFMPTVEQEILFNGHSLEYCQKIVDMFELGALLNRHPQSLSEGQKRKVTIATVLAMRPKVLLLDEPTVGQDYASLKMLINNLNQIHVEEGNTMITVTHDKRCVQSICDKAIKLTQGILQEVGGIELVL